METLPSTARLGVIGGSGLYTLLGEAGSSDAAQVEMIEVVTPFGPPSGPVALGTVGGGTVNATEIAFLPRHGLHHQWPPHRVNYRANIWALQSLGVTRIIAPCAVGSLRAELAPGQVVICDQYVDATHGREGSFFDGPGVNHLAAADPYCPQIGAVLAERARAEGFVAHEGGTVVVIPGPRFASRAESATYRHLGYDVINMTQCPEAPLARELGICYSTIALVTDYDSGLPDRDDLMPVTQEAVFAAFAANIERIKVVLRTTAAEVSTTVTCRCGAAGFPRPSG